MSGRVVVLGGGAVAEAFVAALRRHDEEVPITLVESHLVGGECTYYACMPSKTLLRAPEIVAEARRSPGAAEAVTGELDRDKVFWWRDQVVDNYDDSGMVSWLQDLKVDLVRAHGRVAEPGVVEAGGERIEYEKLVLATGSSAAIPPIDGLDTVEYWTSRDATSSRELPESLIVLGAGPVGCEMAQFYARMGTRVTIVDRSARLLPRDDPEAGELLARAVPLRGDRAALRLGRAADRERGRQDPRPPAGRRDGRRREAARRHRPAGERGRASASSSSASRSRGRGSRSTSGCALRRTSGRSAT